jgi:hypothetical protein
VYSWVRRHEGLHQLYTKDPKTDWWCNYQQQKYVLIDELRAEHTVGNYSYLLRILDRYSCMVNVKGVNSVQLNSEYIIVTSCYPPSRMFQVQQEGDGIEQLLRRITYVIEFPLQPLSVANDGPRLYRRVFEEPNIFAEANVSLNDDSDQE